MQNGSLQNVNEAILKDKNGEQYRLEITVDYEPENPRDWDNLATMYCWHGHYELGDEKPIKSHSSATPILQNLIKQYCNTDQNLDDLSISELEDIFADSDVIAFKRLYLYDHSGITISTSPFRDPWDSGQVGFVFVTKDKMLEETNATEDDWKEKALNVIEGEVQTYDDYITGNVYCYGLYKNVHIVNRCQHCNEIISESDSEELYDSMCGFYGTDTTTNGIETELYNFELVKVIS